MKTTENLTEALMETKPEDIAAVLQEKKDALFSEEKPFAAYMRKTIKSKGLKQQDVFLRADIPEGYGYKLIAEEKHTRQRDVILRLCFGAGFTVDETQRALKLAGLSPLYPRIERDAVLMVALNQGICNISDVNQLLEEHNMEGLREISP